MAMIVGCKEETQTYNNSCDYSCSNRLERTFRDNRLTRIFEGTNQINRLAVIEDQQASILRRISNHLRHVATGEFS